MGEEGVVVAAVGTEVGARGGEVEIVEAVEDCSAIFASVAISSVR